jgi:hypothetical protein
MVGTTADAIECSALHLLHLKTGIAQFQHGRIRFDSTIWRGDLGLPLCFQGLSSSDEYIVFHRLDVRSGFA